MRAAPIAAGVSERSLAPEVRKVGRSLQATPEGSFALPNATAQRAAIAGMLGARVWRAFKRRRQVAASRHRRRQRMPSPAPLHLARHFTFTDPGQAQAMHRRGLAGADGRGRSMAVSNSNGAVFHCRAGGSVQRRRGRGGVAGGSWLLLMPPGVGARRSAAAVGLRLCVGARRGARGARAGAGGCRGGGVGGGRLLHRLHAGAGGRGHEAQDLRRARGASGGTRECAVAKRSSLGPDTPAARPPQRLGTCWALRQARMADTRLEKPARAEVKASPWLAAWATCWGQGEGGSSSGAGAGQQHRKSD